MSQNYGRCAGCRQPLPEGRRAGDCDGCKAERRRLRALHVKGRRAEGNADKTVRVVNIDQLAARAAAGLPLFGS